MLTDNMPRAAVEPPSTQYPIVYWEQERFNRPVLVMRYRQLYQNIQLRLQPEGGTELYVWIVLCDCDDGFTIEASPEDQAWLHPLVSLWVKSWEKRRGY